MDLSSWRQFNFFKITEITNLYHKKDGQDVLKIISSSIVTSGRKYIYAADNFGYIRIISSEFDIVYEFSAYKNGHVILLHCISEAPLLVTIGDEENNSNPILKIWSLESFESSLKAPKCKTTININSNANPYPISCFAVSENVGHIAIGFANGTVLLIKGDLVRDRGSIQRVIYKSEEPVTGLYFKESKKEISLFIITTGKVLKLLINAKIQLKSPEIIDAVGASLGCSTINRKNNDLIIVRDDSIYIYKSNNKNICYSYKSSKFGVLVNHDYVFVFLLPCAASIIAPSTTNISPRNIFDMSQLIIINTENKFIAHVSNFQFFLKTIFMEWGDVYIFSQDEQVFRVQEKSITEKLEILFQKHSYPLAIDLALTGGYTRVKVNDIIIKYGDYLYDNGDFDGSMKQYILSIDQIKPSNIIKKFLNSKHINNLISFLEALYTKRLSNSDHIILLLNCYAKLHDSEKINDFIMKENVEFDITSAITIFRQGGYFDQAAYLANKYQDYDTYLSIQIEDKNDCKKSLEYILDLEPEYVFFCLKKYGKKLLTEVPLEVVSLCIDLFSGTYIPISKKSSLKKSTSQTTQFAIANYVPFLPYVNTNTASSTSEQSIVSSNQTYSCNIKTLPTYAIPSVSSIFPIFINNNKQLIYILEILMEKFSAIDDKNSERDLVCITLYEIYLREIKNSHSSIERQDYEKKAKSILDNEICLIDSFNGLLLSYLTGFSEGFQILKEKSDTKIDAFRYYCSIEDTSKVIDFLAKHGDSESELYLLALGYFISSPRILDDVGDYFHIVLKKIKEERLMTPLEIIKILSLNSIATIGVVREYLIEIIEQERKEIDNNSKLINTYHNDTENKKNKLNDLMESAQILQGMKCSICELTLDLPVVHFLCKHSYHQRCINDLEEMEYCPQCSSNNNMIKAIKKSQSEIANKHNFFQSQLENATDKLKFIFDFLSRGALSMEVR
ncbi:hypothetical protein PNEG_00745 [Pneumocystis murina B123]|uniref:E3 ubiquitin-protein ligase PEP5 n=1 Tax=Pneumocystis murina (strain B123) TaxID=1069680 RepID=M7PL03_PNEMU|nr:hypothetical protein PNEG_00745 [Pneumocystis murina B123]EMR11149.1 hypothetical protein PNEG_00745 [Pneumocystis murina B123]